MALDHTKARKYFSQMKAVGALVYFKLRSQTLSVCSKSTLSPTLLQVSYIAMEWLHTLRSVVQTQATKKERKKHVWSYCIF